MQNGNGEAQQQLRSKLVDYVQDAHAMESDVLQMLESMIDTTDDPQITQILERHREETVQQKTRLEGRLDALGASTSSMKEMGARAAAILKGGADMARGDKAGKNARDAYVTEAMEIAAYELLERTAMSCGDEQTAEVARRNRAEEEAMRRQIESNWDRFFDLQLREWDVPVGATAGRGATQHPPM